MDIAVDNKYIELGKGLFSLFWDKLLGMQKGFYFFGKSFITRRDRKNYVLYLYERLTLKLVRIKGG